MKYRKLFQAKDKKGKLHFIDNLKKGRVKKMTFSCPHCSQKVTPRMGKKNVWHFAHKDKACEKLIISSRNEVQKEEDKTKGIWSFTTKFKVGSDFKMDPKSYQCEFCKVIQSKEYGVKWSDDVYVCKPCYSQLDSERINHLQWKTMK